MQKIQVRPADCEPRPAFQVRAGQRRAAFIAGLVAAAGGAWLVGDTWEVPLNSAWPAAVAVAGAVLFTLAFLIRGNGGEWFAIIGAMIAATGAVLAVQRVDAAWKTWAYAWSAVFPFSVGMAMALFGAGQKRSHTAITGGVYAAVGGAAFLLGAGLYQIVVVKAKAAHLHWIIPAVLTIVGLMFLAIFLYRLRRRLNSS